MDADGNMTGREIIHWIREDFQEREVGGLCGMKPAPTEKEFLQAVKQYAKLNRWLMYHTYDSRRSDPGFPDLVMVRPPRLVIAELKSPRGRLSPAQTVWIEALKLAGHGYLARNFEVYVWYPKDWPEIERVLK